MDNSIIYQTQQLLAHTKIPFDKEELAFQIQSHPSYPSLHAITGVLDHFDIDNLALDVPQTETILEQLPSSFLAQIATTQGNNFALIVKKKTEISVIFSATERKTYSITAFLKKFTGIIVVIEKTEQKAATTSKKNIYRKVLYVILAIIFLGLLITLEPPLLAFSYFTFSILGLFISIAIVKQNFGLSSHLGNTFCSDTETSKNCNSVLSSKGATIFRIFKLSDLSVMYFTSISVFMLVSNFETSALPYVIGILSIPLIVYSIYYQHAFAKAWCPLCLSVAGILLGQSLISIISIRNLPILGVSLEEALLFSGTFLCIYLFWTQVTPLIEKFKLLKQTKIDYFKFKRHFEVFQTFLYQSPKKDTSIPNTGEIVLGNKDADVSIVLVTSPFCGHCKPVHFMVEDLLKKHPQDLSVAIRFPVNTKNKDSDLFKVTSRLTELYHTRGVDSCLAAMHEIYTNSNTQQWLDKWGACKKVELYSDILEKQKNWCLENDINFTPEILVEGRSFPKEYNRSDLAYFIEDIKEASCKEEATPLYNV